MEKLKSIYSLQDICIELKKEGKKIVTTNGAFDLLHKGHIFLFEKAKKQGDVLIVGVNSDRSIREYKSPTRPINSQEDRIAVLQAIEYIDYLTIFDEPTPCNFLRAIQPDIHVKSKEGYKGLEETVIDRDKIILIEDVPNYSSSMLFKKLYHDMVHSDTYRKGQPEVKL